MTNYSAEAEFKKDAVFCIEFLTSKSKVDIKSAVFRNLPDIFTIRERFDPLSGYYSYTVDQQMNLMATYPHTGRWLHLVLKMLR